MQITGMKYGKRILELAGFPTPEILCNDAFAEDIDALIKKRGKVVVKPVFYGGVGKKGKAGLIRIVDNVADAQQARRDLFFARHKFHGQTVTANGATYEEFIPADYEIYFNLNVSTLSRMVSFTLSIDGGVDIEELPPDRIVTHSFDPLTGLKTYHITDALAQLNAPAEIISPLARYLPALWDLYNDYGFDLIEINPIRMYKNGKRYVPYACDFKAVLDKDNPQTKRLNLPPDVFESNLSEFEIEVNALRTYQGQSDVAIINPKGTITPFMFGGGANSAATEILSDRTTISTDFGGNPPFEKMYKIAQIVYKHWLPQSNVVLVIGGKANNTDIFVTFKAIFDALRDYIAQHGPQDIYVVVGRGGPNLIKGMSYAHDLLNSLKIPHRFFGYDSSMVDVIQYAVEIDNWMAARKKQPVKK